MIGPLFKHHCKSHTFMGQVAHGGDLYDIYTAKGTDYGEELFARNGKYYQTMPISMIEGGGMKNTVLEAAKTLVEVKRQYSDAIT